MWFAPTYYARQATQRQDPPFTGVICPHHEGEILMETTKISSQKISDKKPNTACVQRQNQTGRTNIHEVYITGGTNIAVDNSNRREGNRGQ